MARGYTRAGARHEPARLSQHLPVRPMLDTIETHARRAAAVLPASATHWAARGVSETSEQLAVRHGVAEAPKRSRDEGVMLTVVDGGVGYAATPDASEVGLAEAFRRAHALARAGAGRSAYDADQLPRARAQGRYRSAVERPVERLPLADRLALLQRVDASARLDARIVDTQTTLWSVHSDQLFVTGDGARIEQRFDFLTPAVQVTAHHDGVVAAHWTTSLRACGCPTPLRGCFSVEMVMIGFP